MTFQHPSVLLLLVIPAGAARLGVAAARPAGGAALRPRPSPVAAGAGGIVLELAESLPALLLAVAVILLAGTAALRRTGNQTQANQHPTVPRHFLEHDDPLRRRQPLRCGHASRRGVPHLSPGRRGRADLLRQLCAALVPAHLGHPPPSAALRRSCGRSMCPCGSAAPRSAEPCAPARRVLVERQEGDRMIILVTDGQRADLFGGNAEEIANGDEGQRHHRLRHHHRP